MRSKRCEIQNLWPLKWNSIFMLSKYSARLRLDLPESQLKSIIVLADPQFSNVKDAI